jgi:hypothetical protein
MDGTLYIAHSDGYDKHFKHHGTYSIQEFKNVSVLKMSVPVTISSTTCGWKISAPISHLHQPPPIPAPGAFSNYLEALKPWESSLFHSLEMKVYPTDMVSLLNSNPFRSASDGSIKFSTHGSFRWSISLPNGRRLATCSGPVYGVKPSS